MQEVTCFHCRTVVQITPDDDHCSNCGEDLRGLLAAEYVSRYFCERADELAANGQLADALAETERGLAYQDLAELRLLGAILAEELGEYDLMRVHVSAISVDDSLRAEAEWLLRSHQERQRALRAGARRNQPSSVGTNASARDAWGAPTATTRPQRGRMRTWGGAGAVLIAAFVLVLWLGMRQGRGGTLVEHPDTDERVQSLITTPPTSDAPVRAEADNEVTPSPMPEDNTVAPVPSPTPTVAEPTPSVPDDLVSPATETAAIVDSNPRSVVVLNADVFDLGRFLREAGYPELADLPIDARVQDGKLSLTGIVYLDLQRRELLQVLQNAPGIEEVSTVNLLLRPRPTYTVQEGDNLWTIVYNIYGDVDRVEEFYLANIDVVPSPDALTVGEVLQVPPIE